MKYRKYFVICVFCILLMCSCEGDSPTGPEVLVANSSDLNTTVILPHLEVPLEAGRNVLWCGSFQLAWNELSDLVGEDLHFVDEDPMVAVLNKRTFTKDHIDDASVVALAGFVGDNIVQRIRDELEEKFGGEAEPRLLPDPASLPPDTIVAYAYLLKRLAFAVPFEQLEDPLLFQGTAVASFGIGEDYQPEHEDMYPQVSIVDYRHSDDFIIELITTSAGDQLILAKVTPSQTLEETITTVQQRIAQASPVQARESDVLKVPKFDFDLTREYHELENAQFLSENPVLQGRWISTASQNIRFQLNEEGVKLDSEAVIIAPISMPPPSRMMIFDKPFLVMLKRVEAPVPYFALWVDNPELLVR